MSQRLSSSARGSAAADYVSVIDAAPLAPPAKSSRSSPFTSCMQVLRGEKPIDHVALVLQSSLCTNICIVLVMTSVAIASKSLALLSTLVENMVDLFVQGLLWYAGTRGGGKKQDYAKYPAGTSRFEPVAIIVAASVMVLVSVTFIQEGVSKLIDGFVHGNAEAPNLSTTAIILSSTIVVIKIGLVCYSYWTIKRTYSAAAHAIGDDNRNDVASNSLAIAAYIISSSNPELWYVDACGAIFIFLLIMVAWAKMGKEQVAQLVGVSASEEFMTQVKTLSATHHPAMSLDIMRAYHFGSKYLVELEVVVPADMTVKMAHDIALQLQFKVENLEDVERAFVHVDYKQRDYDEHVVSREEDALLTYAGYEAVPLKSGDSSYVAVPVDEIDLEDLDLESDGRVTHVPGVTTMAPVGAGYADGLTTDFRELKG